jgi:hypothetical protein
MNRREPKTIAEYAIRNYTADDTVGGIDREKIRYFANKLKQDPNYDPITEKLLNKKIDDLLNDLINPSMNDTSRPEPSSD